MTEEEKKYKIMLIDDDDFLVNMYATKFSGSDVAVEAYKSAGALIEKLQAGAKTDLILLDIVMPGMTGLEALKQIRQDKLAEGTPVVMLTNQSDEKDITEAKQYGISGYIVKSAATPSEVVSEIIKIIEDSRK
ncbi:MAG: response regulator [Patescibacteria group bacterium]|mgnify:CR=1 FL=1